MTACECDAVCARVRHRVCTSHAPTPRHALALAVGSVYDCKVVRSSAAASLAVAASITSQNLFTTYHSYEKHRADGAIANTVQTRTGYNEPLERTRTPARRCRVPARGPTRHAGRATATASARHGARPVLHFLCTMCTAARRARRCGKLTYAGRSARLACTRGTRASPPATCPRSRHGRHAYSRGAR